MIEAEVDKTIRDLERNINKQNYMFIDNFEEKMIINDIDAMYDFNNF